MSENTITVNLDNLKSDERERLLALVEKASVPKSKPWKPKYEEKIYYLAPRGTILNTKYKEAEEKSLYLLGNCFKTRAKAEFAVERLKVIQRMKEIAAEEEFKNNKYYICYHNYHLSAGLGVDYNTINFYRNDIYFPTKELAEKAIKEIGKDKIKKYYLQVPEN